MNGAWNARRRAVLRAIAGAYLASGLDEAAFATEDTAAVRTSDVLRSLHILDGTVPADERLIEAHKGDRLRLRITSDLAGALHLHAYRLSVTLTPGEPAELTFDAFATGRFRIEWHSARARANPDGGHEAAPLATLEVRPR